MTKLYYLAPYVVTIGMAKNKHPQKLNRRNRGRKARATRMPIIGPTPKFPQPPWAISMVPKPSFAKKKQRTKVLREIRKDPTSNALEAAKRTISGARQLLNRHPFHQIAHFGPLNLETMTNQSRLPSLSKQLQLSKQ